MNRLSTERRAQIIGMLVEGMSMRAVNRLTGASMNTITKLLSDAADAADAFHAEKTRGIRGRRHIQCDEAWGFIYAKEGNVPVAKSAPEAAGDTWTFVGMDTESKLIVSYLVGPRDGQSALAFMDDLRGRLEDRPQISTDGLKAYVEAVDGAFGGAADFAQVIKTYGKADGIDNERRYSPAVCNGIEKVPVWGNPDMGAAGTSHIERQNLSLRMGVRRMTRLTNAFSKRLEKHCAMIALYFHYANWIKPHGAVRTKRNNRITPAMAAGLTDRPATFTQLVELIDARAPAVNYARTYNTRKRRAA